MAMNSLSRPLLKHVPQSALYVSEPNPAWFGNGKNENLPNWSEESQNWLKSRFHFAFAEYSNRNNSNFGCLRVMNDDLVQPNRGFGQHGHADAEIMTYVVHGSLVHQDSMGNKGEVTRGGIQYMSAGSGVRHSEYNNGNTPLRFIQCWVTPERRGVDPNYGQFDGCLEDRLDGVQHLASSINNKDVDTPIKVHQDVNLYATEFTQLGKSVNFILNPGRMMYLLCIEGSLRVSDGDTEITINKHDAVELQGKERLVDIMVTCSQVEVREGGGSSAHFIFFEMKQDQQGGRSDI